MELSRELLWIAKISSFARGVKKLQCFLKESHFSSILSVSSWLQCLATDSLAFAFLEKLQSVIDRATLGTLVVHRFTDRERVRRLDLLGHEISMRDRSCCAK